MALLWLARSGSPNCLRGWRAENQGGKCKLQNLTTFVEWCICLTTPEEQQQQEEDGTSCGWKTMAPGSHSIESKSLLYQTEHTTMYFVIRGSHSCVKALCVPEVKLCCCRTNRSLWAPMRLYHPPINPTVPYTSQKCSEYKLCPSNNIFTVFQ